MKSDIQIIRIEPHTPEWYEFRRNGIGGTDVGTILGLNKYDTAARVYHEKVGTISHSTEDNAMMFWGREMEDKIAQVWKYYDGTDFGYIENYKNDKVIRECRSVNGFVVNPKYPWLFGSLDRLINIKGGVNFLTGEALTTEAVLECKTLTYWASQIWEDGIPPYYLTQVMLYMILIESDYAEIAILQDGNKFRVERIARNEKLCNQIIKLTKIFWETRILPAKEALKKKNMAVLSGNLVAAESNDAIIQHLEPDPDGSEAYKDLMQERFLKTRNSVNGTISQFQICMADTFYQRLMARIAIARRKARNSMIKYMTEYGTDVIDFGRSGNVTWSEVKGRKNRKFTIRIKDKPSGDRVEEEFEKIDFNY